MSYVMLMLKFQSGDDGYDKDIKNPAYIPNIGESVHNERDSLKYYEVMSKEIYYNEGDTHILIKLQKKTS